MKEETNQKIEEFLLDAFEFEEPLHLILRSLMKEGLYTNSRQISNVFMKLYKRGYFKIKQVPDVEGEEWIKITDFTEKDLLDYISENEKEGFEKHPEREYYIETTKAGAQYYEKNYADWDVKS